MVADRTRTHLDELKEIPHEIPTEQGVLGALLSNNGLYARVADLLDENCFHDEIHRLMFKTIKGLIETGQAATPSVVENYLPPVDGMPQGKSLRQYMVSMMAERCEDIKAHALVLKAFRDRRVLFSIAKDIEETALYAAADTTSRVLINAVYDRLGEVKIGNLDHQDFVDFASASAKALAFVMDGFAEGGASINMLSTGYPQIDEVIGGLRGTDLIVLGGRPGMGKTALGTNIAVNACRQLQERMANGLSAKEAGVVAFFSLEMSKEQLSNRILSAESKVEGWRISRRKLNQEHIDRMAEAYGEQRRMPLLINEARVTVQQILVKARQIKKERGLALLVIDYLQIIAPSSRGHYKSDRYTEVTEISAALKEMAKELEVPVLALSQLNRKTEDDPDARPTLRNLRESGAIEQDADIIMFVYREEYYLKDRKLQEGSPAWREWQRKLAIAENKAEILIEKNRHGHTGNPMLGFQADLTLFTAEVPAVDPEDERLIEAPKPVKNANGVKLSPHAMLGGKVLAELLKSHPIEAEGQDGIDPAVGTVVAYHEWRTRVALLVMGEDHSDKQAFDHMKTKVFPDLYNSGLVARSTDVRASWVWLTAKGQEVFK